MALGDLLVRVGANIAGFESAMGTVSQRLNAIDREANKTLGGFTKLGDRLVGMGTALTAGVTVPLAAIATASASAFSGFEQSLNRVSALGEITGKDLDKLKAQAIDLGARTQFSAKQAADGMGELAAAGFKAVDVMAAMPGVLNLAAAGQLSVGEAAQTTAALMGGFGISADGVGHAVDVMAKSAASGALGVGDLGLSFKYIGPIATAAGISFEESAAAVTLLSNAGIKGEQSGTSLRQAISRLIDPPKAAAEALERLGVSTQDSSGKMRPFADIIEDLGRKGASTKDIFAIFGDTAASSMQALVNKGGPALRAMTAELQNSDGAAAKMAGTINSGLAGAVERMKGSVETAGITLGEALAPTLIKVAGLIETGANQIAEFGKWFGTLPEPVQNTALALGAVAAALGPALLVAGQFSLAITSISAVLPMASTGLTALTGALGVSTIALAGWTAGIGLAVVAIYKVWDAWDGWKKAQAEAEKASDDSANALLRLERHLRSNGKAVDALKDEYKRGQITLKDYERGLQRMAIELGDQRKAQGLVADSTSKTKTAQDQAKASMDAMNRVLAQQTSAVKGASAGMTEYAAKTEPVVKRNEVLDEMTRILTQRHQAHIHEIAKARIALLEWGDAIDHILPISAELDKSITDMIGSSERLRAASAPLGIDLSAAIKAPIPAAAEAGKAIEGIGDKVGTVTSKSKEAWSDWSKQVSTIVTDWSRETGKILFDGDLSWGEKGKKMLESLGQAVTRMFVEPAQKAIGDLISGTIADLLGGKGLGGVLDSLKNVGKAVVDVFGGSAGAATAAVGSVAGGAAELGVEAGGAAAGVAGSVGGAASSAGSAAGAGATAIAGAVGGIVSAISGVIGNFQMMGMNKSLDIIVMHTLQTANDLANLRRDEWDRETHLMRKLDDIWNTIGEGFSNAYVRAGDIWQDVSGISGNVFSVLRVSEDIRNSTSDLVNHARENMNIVRQSNDMLAQVRDGINRMAASRGAITIRLEGGTADQRATASNVLGQLNAQGAFI